jgi:hypothetical protein
LPLLKRHQIDIDALRLREAFQRPRIADSWAQS